MDSSWGAPMGPTRFFLYKESRAGHSNWQESISRLINALLQPEKTKGRERLTPELGLRKEG